jgi:uroporphyrin-III C-methyltransferase/precorrin-2 dehydrogenase/sirohydrochlorin ferrochelatase
MDYLPVSLRLKGEPVLLVGAGQVATRKARLLLKAGAGLTVVAPDICEELEALLAEQGGVWQESQYASDLLKDQRLVVAATPDSAVNEQVSTDARKLNIPVNVVDSPELCTVFFPSIVDRSPLTVAISSGGQSPVLTRLLRTRIEALVPASYGRLASFAGRWRDKVKDAIADPTARRRFWESIVEGGTAEAVLAGNENFADKEIAQKLASPEDQACGEVYLLGAGPGDPDLMTFKAVRLLQKADVVLHDRLVAPEIIDMARRDAERIYVGKRRSEHAVEQTEINQMLLDLAREGKCVARLKGGDPFIFGRGGEEIELLAQHNVRFQVVPGITAASGAACYSGIPLTHRDHAQSVRFITGHLKDGRLEHNWQQLQDTSETLVFYMGLLGLPVICEELVRHGREPGTPVALVERACTAQQRVMTGTLDTIVDVVAENEAKAPTIIIVGGVVKLAASLSWYPDGGD